METRARSREIPAPICPACAAPIDRAAAAAAWLCPGCGRAYPDAAGMADLRVAGDRYLDLDGDRAKAGRLAAVARSTDLAGLVDAYYAATADVDDRRRSLYLGHIRAADARGEALAATLPRDGLILEVGCGTGGFVAAAAASGRSVVGVDVALRWLVAARRRLDDRGLDAPLVGASADRLPWPAATFDAVVADSVLEHLDDPAAALREWARVLRPGGALRAWSPNRGSILPDPHVGLWGVGWMPRRLAPAYVRWRRGCAWDVRPIGPGAMARLIGGGDWSGPVVEAAPLSAAMLADRGAARAWPAYRAARRRRASAALLRAIAPIWQARATRSGAA